MLAETFGDGKLILKASLQLSHVNTFFQKEKISKTGWLQALLKCKGSLHRQHTKTIKLKNELQLNKVMVLQRKDKTQLEFTDFFQDQYFSADLLRRLL